MKKLLLLIPLILFFACNGPDKTEEKTIKLPEGETSYQAVPIPMSAILPNGQQYDVLASGDSNFYKKKDTTVFVPFTYQKDYIELHPKKTDTVPTTNQPPIARAGNDATITLPVSTIQLNASASTDPEGATLKYFWRQTAGPSKATLVDTNKVVCTASSLKEGVYTFELRAVDPLNAFSADFISITVKPEVVTPPVGSITPFSFTKNTAFKQRNFSGYEDWNGQNYTSFGGGFRDKYFRFVWTDIEKQTQGNYVWTRFDQEFNKAISVGAKFSFGIFMVNDSDDFLAYEAFNGTWARYPKYVHDNMQASSVKDYVTNGQWIPNWNSTFMLDRYAALLQAIQAHLVSKGWQDKVNYIDIRGYGQWGEWHSVGFGQPVTSQPSGTRISVSSYKRFIDAHVAAFPDIQLVMILAAMDANWLDNTMTPPEVTDYILKAKNNVGLFGLRRDQWGATDGYVKDYLENNNRSFGSSGPFKNIIMERWKVAPWVGEPMGPGSNLSDLPRQVTFYHAASVGNGNYTADANSQNYFKQAEANAGYKIALTSGVAEVRTNGDFLITMKLENFGNTPCYENYDVTYQLKNSSGSTVWTSSSSWHPALKIPGTYSFTDTFRPNVSGTYSLSVVIKNNYRSMPLFNNSQASDGSIKAADIKF